MSILVRDEHKVLNALKIPAIKGKSAYEIACENGFNGTEKQWLNSLQGENGSQEIYVGKASEAPKTATMVIDLEDENEYDGFFTDSKYDYLGKAHSRLKEVNDSNIEHVLRKVNTQKYEGSSITANNTYMKQVNNVILKGVTKFKDLDTGDFIDRFEEGKNLELVGGKIDKIKIRNTNFIMLKSGDIVVGRVDNDGTLLPHNKYGVMLREDLYIEAPPNKYCWIFSSETDILNDTVFAYDENKRFISKINLYTPTPPNTKFIKFYCATTYEVDENLSIIEEVIKKCKGVFIDSYVPTPEYTNIPIYQANDLVLSNENPVYTLKNTYDYVNLKTGTYVKNIEMRAYQPGDESNSEVLTDKKSTLYKLEDPVVSKIDLKGQKIYSYDGTTYYNCISEAGYPSPILSMEVPTDLASLVQEERAINKQLYNDQNIIINSQLSLYEAMSAMLLEDNNTIPQYIQDLYELAYERGIRSKEQEDI